MPVRAPLAAILLLSFHGSLVFAQQSCPEGEALVIGNSSYQSLRPKPSSANDAHEIAERLRALKIPAIEQPNLNFRELEDTLKRFARGLRPGELGFFYYSGFAVQFENDLYFLPTDFRLPSDSELPQYTEQSAISLSRLQSLLQARNGPNILVLDLWRNAGLAGKYHDMAQAQQRSETLIAYPSPPNQVTSAGTGSAFSRHLIEALKRPGLSPEGVMNYVREELSKNAGSGQDRQVVIVNSSMGAECYLTGPPPVSELPTGTIRTNPQDNQVYVWIRGGQFQMGCVPGDSKCGSEENPRHSVAITKGFWMGQNEVPVSTYRNYMNQIHGKMPRASQVNRGWSNEAFPMVEVTWEEAGKFCQWAGGRLPTEAEWEYAARGGAEGLIYPWGNSLKNANAHYAGSHGAAWPYMAPVKQFKPNSWGLYDMAGNVWEWSSDWYDPGFYSQSPKENPTGPASGKTHVTRGGDYNSAEKELRTSIRRPDKDRQNNVGFRCVLEKLP